MSSDFMQSKRCCLEEQRERIPT